MYKVIDKTGNVYNVVTYTEYDRPVMLVVDYDKGDAGEPERFSTSGMVGRVSWGSPACPSQIEIIEAFILDKNENIIMEIALNHMILAISEDDLLECIEDHIKEKEMDRF